ncbi:MAG: hypothetical protein ACI97N_001044 [Cognaticolwellia sp.]
MVKLEGLTFCRNHVVVIKFYKQDFKPTFVSSKKLIRLIILYSKKKIKNQIMRKLILPILLICTVATFSFAQTVNITFELNSATLGTSIDAAGIFLAGGSEFGVPGDNPMADPDGDGIYTITIAKPVGTTSNFTFLNGNCGDWSCKENLSGLPCADPANYNDRYLPAVMSDTTIQACFGTCDSDGSCTIVTDSINITFAVNTASIGTIDPTGIFLAGGGNFGNPGENPMSDADADGTYTITVRKPKGFQSDYTFTNGDCGDWSCKEDITGLSCAVAPYNDRNLQAVYSDTTITTCFAECSIDGTCTTGTNELLTDNALFSLRPTLVNNYANVTFGENVTNDEKQILVINAVGQVILSTRISNTNTYQIDATDYPNGLYFITVNTAETKLTQKFVVAK